MKDIKAIKNQIRLAREMNGTFDHMTYEEGIRDALNWILYGDENKPCLLD